MGNFKFKKTISLFLSLLMIFMMIPATTFTSLGAEIGDVIAIDDTSNGITVNKTSQVVPNTDSIEKSPMINLSIFSPPEIEPVSLLSTTDESTFSTTSDNFITQYKSDITSITFLSIIDYDSMNASDTIDKCDVSEAQNESVMAWLKDDGSMYIGATYGNVIAPTDSSDLFEKFYSARTINGLEYLDTSNVTNMSGMFSYCFNLTELNLSNFDTSSVTNMSYMFYDCSGLTSLDLSNFDTSSVTSMYYMFAYCSSLASLNVSNFDTSNVEYTSIMFSYCSSLTELDLSNFNTENVTEMTYMFEGCENLEAIYVGKNWNVNNVIFSDDMFYNCKKLKNYNDDYTDKTYAHCGEDGYLTHIDNKPIETNVLGANTALEVKEKDYIIYDLTVKYENDTNINSDKVTVTDTIPEGLTFVEDYFDTTFVCDNSDYFVTEPYYDAATNEIKFVVDNLPANAAINVQFVCQVDELLDNEYDKYFDNTAHFSCENGETGDSNTVTHYISGNKRLYTVTYDINGAEGVTPVDTNRYKANDNLTVLSDKGFIKKDHSFKGWQIIRENNNENNKVEVIQPGTILEIRENITLKAIWSKVTVEKSAAVTQNKPEYPTMRSYFDTNLSWYDDNQPYNADDYHAYKENIYSITFLNKIDKVTIAECEKLGFAWDVSVAGDGSVMAWMKLNDEETAAAGEDRYDVYIAGIDGVWANPDSSYLFYNFEILKVINGLENFYTENVTNMSYMFKYCSSLTSLDLSRFNTENVTDMADMFNSCWDLTELDLSSWNTSNVTNMDAMFASCSALTSLDIGNFDTSKVTNMNSMFDGCSSLTSLDLSSFDTSKVTTMAFMFCDLNLVTLDLSFFNTSSVTNMNAMFADSTYLTTIYVSEKWNTLNVTNSTSMFRKCMSLKNYNGRDTNKTKAHYDSGGYLTYKETNVLGSNTKLTNEIEVKEKDYVIYDLTVKYENDTNINSDKITVFDVLPEGLTFIENYFDTTFVYSNSNCFVTEPHYDATTNKVFFEVESLPANTQVTVKFACQVDELSDEENGKFFYNTANFTEENGKTNVSNTTSHYIPADETLYTIKYIYTGDVPEGIETITEIKNYKGTKIEVLTVPSVNGYIFTGWTSNDVNIDNGSFILKGDTTIAGEWIKCNLTANDVTVKINESDNVNANIDNINNPTFTYKIKDPTIATVDQNGNVTGIKEGATTVKITNNESGAEAEVTVAVVLPNYSLTINGANMLPVDSTEEYVAVPNPELTDAVTGSITWTTSDDKIASVDATGKVTGVSPGTVTITATLIVNGKEVTTATKEVIVYNLTANDVTVEIGGTDNVDAAVDGIKDPTFTYEVVDKDIATVDKDGNVTGLKEGTTTIKVTNVETGDVVEVTVTVILPEYTLSIDGKDKIHVNDSELLSSLVTPALTDATVNEITWTTSDDKIASVDATGKVTGVAPGTVTITATLIVNGKEVAIATKDITVYELTANDVTVEIGGADNVDADVDGIKDPTFTYEVVDKDIATIDKDGNVTGLKEGTTTIKVTNVETGDVVEVTVIVVLPEYTLSIEGKNKIYINDTEYYKAIPAPELTNAVTGIITWSIDDESIATIDAVSGKVTGINPGTVTIASTLNVNGKDVATANKTIIVETYEISAKDIIVRVDESKQIESTFKDNIKPENDTIIWESKDTTIAVVSDNNSVIGKNPGVTTFVGTLEGTNIKTEITVTVYNFTIIGKDEMTTGENQTLKPIITPELPDNTVNWFTEDTDIIEINPLTGDVKAISAGVAIVTATLAATGAVATFLITVKDPNYDITAPDEITIYVNQSKNLDAKVTPNYNAPKLTYTSLDETIAKVDKNGKVTGIAVGTTTVTVSLENGKTKEVKVNVISNPDTKQTVVFGKTDGIGWYLVSTDGGKTFNQIFGNSTVEFTKGSQIIIKVGDIMGDSFTFYVNGNAVEPDENGCITLTVNDYMLIGATSVKAPDIEESLNWFQKIIKAIKDFFAKLFGKK